MWNIDKCLDFAKEQKNLWNMKVTVIGIIIGTMERIFKNLEKRQ